jgi:Delta6-protoilludene synthase
MPSTTTTTAPKTPQKMLYLPETMKNWPWKRAINPHYEEVTAESNTWFKSFKPFNEKSQHAFDKCDIGE